MLYSNDTYSKNAVFKETVLEASQGCGQLVTSWSRTLYWDCSGKEVLLRQATVDRRKMVSTIPFTVPVYFVISTVVPKKRMHSY